MKRVAAVLGRGIEGVGITKSSVELQKWCRKRGIECDILGTDDKMWGRRDSMTFDREYFGSSVEAMAGIAERLEKYDVVIYFSIPSVKHSDECKQNFLDIVVRGVKGPKKVLINLDHNTQSFMRNANFVEIMEASDVVICHSLNGKFANYVRKNQPELVKKLRACPLGVDYDEHRKKFWEPIDSQDDRLVRWIGRSAYWKGPLTMIDFHNASLKERGFMTVMEGVERSIGSLHIFFSDIPNKVIRTDTNDMTRLKKYDASEFEYGSWPWIIGPYTYDECMKRVATSAFGSDLYHLHAGSYGRSLEYCHADVVASGAVPVFHKHFGDNCLHLNGKDFLTSMKDTGTVWVDETNFEESGALMERLSADRSMRDDWREMAFSFWKGHSDSDLVYAEFFELINASDDELIADTSNVAQGVFS